MAVHSTIADIVSTDARLSLSNAENAAAAVSASLPQKVGAVSSEIELLAQSQATKARLGGESLWVKPDGTALDPNAVPGNIVKGKVSKGSADTTPLQTPHATVPITAPASAKSATTHRKNLTKIIPNVLENFASYSPLWTFAVLDPKQFNNPDLYRKNPADLTNIVFSSAGRYDSQRVQLIEGTPEYFINNLVMKSTIAANEKTGNSNAYKIDFEVFEPFSMGMLLMSMQQAAVNAAYSSYLDNSPWVLRLDFEGFNEEGQRLHIVKPRFFVMKLTSATFSVTEAGTNYKIQGIPYNQQGFGDAINTSYHDIKLACEDKGTVDEVLQSGISSLAAALNLNEENLIKDKKTAVADEYIISFPSAASAFNRIKATPKLRGDAKATVDVNQAWTDHIIQGTTAEIKEKEERNAIGAATFGFDASTGGHQNFSKPSDVYDEKTGVIHRDKMALNVTNKTFQFAQGQTLTGIINQVILSSQYAKAAMLPVNMENGFIKWWRLDVQIELKNWDHLTAEYAKRYTFRVIPYLVHHSVFTNASATMIGYDAVEKKVCKEYNYIFTGQNVDIIKFDIQINNLFYTAVNPSTEKDSAKVSNNDSGGTVTQARVKTQAGDGKADLVNTPTSSHPRAMKSQALFNRPGGGTGTATVQQVVAENFMAAFVQGSSADLITVNLEILGDLFWLVESGIGNYFSIPSENNSQVTESGSLNYEDGDVFVYLTFKTPSDVDERAGGYRFAAGGGSTSTFSGLYRVFRCESRFSDGTFKQVLSAVRMPGQVIGSPAGTSGAGNSDNAFTTKIAEVEQDANSPTSPAPQVNTLGWLE